MADSADMPESLVMNPEAIGDPDQTPIVFVGSDLRALLHPCACGGVNGFHKEDCNGRSAPACVHRECQQDCACWCHDDPEWDR